MSCRWGGRPYIYVPCGAGPVTDGVLGTAGAKGELDAFAVDLPGFAVAGPSYREAAGVVGHCYFDFNSLDKTI